MNYSELIKKAEGSKKVERLGTQVFKFSEKGEKFVGVLIGIARCKGKKSKSEFLAYHFGTPDGKISTVLGKSIDVNIRPHLKKDTVYRIEFLGQKDLDEGKKLNQYLVEQLGELGKEDPDDLTGELNIEDE